MFVLAAVASIAVAFGPNTAAVQSSKDISNVVILDCAGNEYKIESPSTNIFTDEDGIVTIWVKAGDNHSGDGPGYGQRFDNEEAECPTTTTTTTGPGPTTSTTGTSSTTTSTTTPTTQPPASPTSTSTTTTTPTTTDTRVSEPTGETQPLLPETEPESAPVVEQPNSGSVSVPTELAHTGAGTSLLIKVALLLLLSGLACGALGKLIKG